jgi:hypothetical protein
MQALNSLALAAGVTALAFGALAAPSAKAADMGMPEGQYGEGPPPQYYGQPPAEEGYGQPPAEEGYAYPPPAGYDYPPPPAYAYAEPRIVVVPGPYYYAPGPYWGWRGYGPRFAYGYAPWGRPYRRW